MRNLPSAVFNRPLCIQRLIKNSAKATAPHTNDLVIQRVPSWLRRVRFKCQYFLLLLLCYCSSSARVNWLHKTLGHAATCEPVAQIQNDLRLATRFGLIAHYVTWINECDRRCVSRTNTYAWRARGVSCLAMLICSYVWWLYSGRDTVSDWRIYDDDEVDWGLLPVRGVRGGKNNGRRLHPVEITRVTLWLCVTLVRLSKSVRSCGMIVSRTNLS